MAHEPQTLTSLDDFLEAEGIREEVDARAIERLQQALADLRSQLGRKGDENGRLERQVRDLTLANARLKRERDEARALLKSGAR